VFLPQLNPPNVLHLPSPYTISAFWGTEITSAANLNVLLGVLSSMIFFKSVWATLN